jgi:DMSO/TMAO reductase YedYZ molybdopterin-dependent catalytic subunit
VTQGLHVTAGVACLPLLLAKLYAVYPRLFARPPVRGPGHGLERAGIGLLVAATAFELVTGVMNVAQWYPWGFGFVPVHHAVAWLAAGALAVHVAVKLPVIGETLAQRVPAGPDGRRAFLTGSIGAAAALALLTAGQTVRPLQRLALLAPRRPSVGPQGLPVNRTAAAAGVAAAGPDWTLVLTGPAGARTLSRAELAAMPQRTAELPIACVEGWSATATWRGVGVRDLVALAGGDATSTVRVESLERGGAYRASTLPPAFAADPRTLLALELNGADLDLDHGYPARLIAPDRPGVLQTKWVARLAVGAAS